jgi:hypothetical protein
VGQWVDGVVAERHAVPGRGLPHGLGGRRRAQPALVRVVLAAADTPGEDFQVAAAVLEVFAARARAWRQRD